MHAMHAVTRVGAGVGRLLLLAAVLAALIVPGPIAAGPSPPPLNGRPAPGAPVSAQTLRQFTTTEPVIALTFDAGSDRGGAERVLDVARERGIRLTFGITGTWASQNPDLLRRMVGEGHQLINHTWDHLSWTGYSTPGQPAARTPAARAAELSRTDDFVFAQTGMHLTPYFRAPYGDYDDGVLADLAANGYRYNVLWTQGLDTLGWQGASVAQITATVLDHAAPGAIVLMHVGETSRDADALAGIIDRLRERGYRFATVEELAEGRPETGYRFFPQSGHGIAHGFLGYWDRFGGLPVFGYPLTEERIEGGVTVQYFERAVLEQHSGLWPARYDILLRRLGSDLTAGRRAAGEPPFRPIQAGSDGNCTFFAQTGHRLCFGFRAYWEAHGGLAIYGYPINEEFREGGYTVQYFERQRFEYHPENRAPWDIEGGLLGVQTLAAQG